jgi:hypothetical protein
MRYVSMGLRGAFRLFPPASLQQQAEPKTARIGVDAPTGFSAFWDRDSHCTRAFTFTQEPECG